MTYSYLWFSIADWLAETQFDDLECRDPLHVGRAEYSDCFAALNVGLQSAAKSALCVLGCLKDGGDQGDEGRYNRAAGPSAQHSGPFRRARRNKKN
jgi:hypothetical protein